MRAEGEAVKSFRAVRLDTMLDVNSGELVAADDITVYVVCKDIAGENKEITLGPHVIRILPKLPR